MRTHTVELALVEGHSREVSSVEISALEPQPVDLLVGGEIPREPFGELRKVDVVETCCGGVLHRFTLAAAPDTGGTIRS